MAKPLIVWPILLVLAHLVASAWLLSPLWTDPDFAGAVALFGLLAFVAGPIGWAWLARRSRSRWFSTFCGVCALLACLVTVSAPISLGLLSTHVANITVIDSRGGRLLVQEDSVDDTATYLAEWLPVVGPVYWRPGPLAWPRSPASAGPNNGFGYRFGTRVKDLARPPRLGPSPGQLVVDGTTISPGLVGQSRDGRVLGWRDGR